MEVPIYIINGFLESGKTSFIKDTLSDPEFSNEGTTLIVCCEQGVEEYSDDELKKLKANVEYVDDIKELNAKFFFDNIRKYKSKRIMIEFNGMWKMSDLLAVDLNEDLPVVQIISIIDASTYKNYISNMKAIMLDLVKQSDTVIFNRCDDSTDTIWYRRTIKPVNRKAQIVYERSDGAEMNAGEDIMPFDIKAPVIEILDEDYGLWYLDAMDNPQKYDGKKVTFLAQVYKSPKLPANSIVPGRFAMTCCAADITFVGFLCKVTSECAPLKYDNLVQKQFIKITADIKIEYYKEYKGKGPVLYATEIEDAKAPEDTLVYYS